MDNFWNGFEKKANFVHGGWAMKMLRDSKKMATPTAVRSAAKAATTAATKPMADITKQSLSRTTLGGALKDKNIMSI